MSRLAAALLFLAGIVHVVLGVSAIAGTARLEANVQEIETSAVGGDLYFALGVTGLIMTAVGVLELVAAGLLYARGASAKLIGLILFATSYLLTYQVGEAPE